MVQGAYLTLAPGEVRLALYLAPGSPEARRILTALDTHGDRPLTETEARRFGEQVLRQGALALDGVAVPWTLDHMAVPPYRVAKSGHETLKVHGVARWADTEGAHTLDYQHLFPPATARAADVCLQPATGWHCEVTRQDRRDDEGRLHVSFTRRREAPSA
jgi:hypothetical protein